MINLFIRYDVDRVYLGKYTMTCLTGNYLPNPCHDLLKASSLLGELGTTIVSTYSLIMNFYSH
jgi:hypothetical protein